MSSGEAKEIEHWMRVYESQSDAEVLAAKSSWRETAPGWVAAEEIMKKRTMERDTSKPQLLALNEQVTVIAGRLKSIEVVARCPEYKTWIFWLAIVGLLLGVASLSRDYWDITARL